MIPEAICYLVLHALQKKKRARLKSITNILTSYLLHKYVSGLLYSLNEITQYVATVGIVAAVSLDRSVSSVEVPELKGGCAVLIVEWQQLPSKKNFYVPFLWWAH